MSVNTEELEGLTGIPTGYTQVPLEEDGKRSVKVKDHTRQHALNICLLPPMCRLFITAMLFACGVQISNGQLTDTGVDVPSGDRNHLPDMVDPVTELFGLTGSDFVRRYIELLDPDIAQIVLPYTELFDPPDSPFNDFSAYRANLGLPTAGVWLPDLWEVESIGGLRASGGHQVGIHTKSNALPRTVPHGL